MVAAESGKWVCAFSAKSLPELVKKEFAALTICAALTEFAISCLADDLASVKYVIFLMTFHNFFLS